MQVNVETKIDEEEGVSVTLLDANHCPGAVLFLFNVRGIYHLHTGDMRYASSFKNYPELQGIKINNLYLDTTYCDNDYSFPPQSEAIQLAIDIMRKEVNLSFLPLHFNFN